MTSSCRAIMAAGQPGAARVVALRARPEVTPASDSEDVSSTRYTIKPWINLNPCLAQVQAWSGRDASLQLMGRDRTGTWLQA